MNLILKSSCDFKQYSVLFYLGKISFFSVARSFQFWVEGIIGALIQRESTEKERVLSMGEKAQVRLQVSFLKNTSLFIRCDGNTGTYRFKDACQRLRLLKTLLVLL